MIGPDDASPRLDRRRWQFSLRTLLVATAVVAVLCSVLVTLGGLILVPVLLFATLGVPATLVTVAIHGTSYQRTFSIGALFPSVYLCLKLPFWPYESPLPSVGLSALWQWTVSAVPLWGIAAALGFLCVKIRRRLESAARRDGADPRKG